MVYSDAALCSSLFVYEELLQEEEEGWFIKLGMLNSSNIIWFLFQV